MKNRDEDDPEHFRKTALDVIDRRATPRRATEAEVRRAYEKLSEQWDMLWELGDETVRELMIKVSEKCQ